MLHSASQFCIQIRLSFFRLSVPSFPVRITEARQVRAAFAAMRVKTDRNDAHGIAQLVRLGWFKRMHVKSLDAQETRALLTARAFLVEKVTATESSLRAALRNFGLKMGTVTRPIWAIRARFVHSPCAKLDAVPA